MHRHLVEDGRIRNIICQIVEIQVYIREYTLNGYLGQPYRCQMQ
jgi:hypothetical protein